MKAIAAVALLLTLSSVSLTNAFAQPSAPTQNARFQIVFNPNIRADTFLLDTQTGQVWQLTHFPDANGDPSAWSHMDRLDDEKQVYQFYMRHGVKETAQSTAPSK